MGVLYCTSVLGPGKLRREQVLPAIFMFRVLYRTRVFLQHERGVLATSSSDESPGYCRAEGGALCPSFEPGFLQLETTSPRDRLAVKASKV